MKAVLPGLLWIGNARDARDVSSVLKLEIQAVVDVAAEEAAIAYPRDIIYCRIPLMDGDGNSPAILQTAISTLAELIRSNTPTLVACGLRMSRAPSIAAAALCRARHESAEFWLTQIAEHGPLDVSPALWRNILQLQAASPH